MRESQKRATAKYNKANYYRVTLNIPKDWEQILKEYVTENETSVGGLLNGCLEKILGKHQKEKRKREKTEKPILVDMNEFKK